MEQLPKHLPLGWVADSAEIVDVLYSLRVGEPTQRKGLRHYNLLYAGSTRLARTLNLDELFDRLESDLQLASAYLATDKLFVHAGVVGWQDQAILLPGRSFVGKSTLVTALIRAGATYYSDEYAVLDRAGRVHPYARPLSIRAGSGQKPGKYPVEGLGGRAGVEPLPVRLIVVTEFHAGARWQARKLTPSRALLALMENTVAARKDPTISLPILKQVVSGATAIKSKRGEAAEVVANVLNGVSELPGH
jgi:hypothetical protein